MANQEQLEIIKQGVDVQNIWRSEYSDVKIDLSEANLSKVKLSGANLRGADFSEAILKGSDLSGVNLIGSDLSDTDLSGAVLSGADLVEANLIGANLRGTNLREAILRRTDLSGVNLSRANVSYSKTSFTSFGDVDLSSCLGLETIVHLSPSRISTSTLEQSKGQIPVEFLRGCGLSDWEIESAKLYNPELSNQEISELQYKIYDLRATWSIQVFPLFISYSHADSSFVDELGK